jgi:hypothetical protein
MINRIVFSDDGLKTLKIMAFRAFFGAETPKTPKKVDFF